jgi:lipopolysaccharide export system permease protein
MILYRYLSRQLFATTLAATTVLVVILVGGRFLKYLSDAADGQIAKEVLFALTAYRMPDFLQMILPLGLFLGVLLCYGRLYTDNEMTVMQSSGLGPRHLLQMTAIPIACMALVVGLFSLWLGPWGLQNAERIFVEQESSAGVNTIAPGRFHASNDRAYVTYVESLSEDRQVMQKLYVVQQLAQITVVVAAQLGTTEFNEFGQHFLKLQNGHRYEGVPGQANFKVMQFAEYWMPLSEPDVFRPESKVKTTSTWALIRNIVMPTSFTNESDQQKTANLRAAMIAELAWRLSMPLLVPIIACLAIPLSRVNPRQGRFIHILPSILIYLAYLVLLSAVKRSQESGSLPVWANVWWVHLLFAGLAAMLFCGDYLKRLRLKL